MTSAESTLLGIVIGAALTWLANALTDRSQWRREEWKRAAERRRDLYQDMIAETDRSVRDLLRLHKTGIRPDPLGDEARIEREVAWRARAVLSASKEVSDLWMRWVALFDDGWNSRPTPPQAIWSLDAWTRQVEIASAALYEQMRRELEGNGRRRWATTRGPGRSG